MNYSHAEITERCLEKSDAVMFLRSPRSPLETTEIDFLEKVFHITDNVIFIQTMVDKYDEHACSLIAERDQAILSAKLDSFIKERYERKIPFHFWPISSTLLLDAAQDINENKRHILLQASHFEELLTAIELLIYRTSGYTTTCIACFEAVKYHDRTLASINDELEMLSAASKEERENIQRLRKQKQDDFNANWGAKSERMKKLNEEFALVLRTAVEYTRNRLSPGGELQNEFLGYINQELPDDLQQIQEFADTLASELPQRITETWQRIVRVTQREIATIFDDFKISLDRDMFSDINNSPQLNYQMKRSTLFETSRNLISGSMIGGSVGYVAATGIMKVGAVLAPWTGGASVPISALLSGLAILIGPIWGGKGGLNAGNKTNAKQAKTDLINAINKYFRDVWQELNGSQIGRTSQVDQFFGSIKKDVTAQFTAIVERENQKLSDENNRLANEIQMSESARTEKKQILLKIQKQLSDIGPELEACLQELDTINHDCTF